MKVGDLKDREDRYGRGVTRKEILKYILNFADGVEEPKIRGFLRDEFNISAMRNIKTHLEKLENDGYIIKKISPGEANIWTINYDNFDLISLFIVEEIRQNEFFFNTRERSLAVLNAKGTQYFIFHHLSKSDLYADSIWGTLLRNYIFNEMVDSPTVIDHIIGMFCELIGKSPSLFRAVLGDNTDLQVIAGITYNSVKLNVFEGINDADLMSEYRKIQAFAYKIIAPCVLDAIMYPSQKPIISEYLYGVDSRWFGDPEKFIFHEIYRTLLARENDLNNTFQQFLWTQSR